MKNKKFEEYFLRYKDLVIRIVVNKTGDYQLAQEIEQQVFMSLYQNMEQVEAPFVKAWLIRCTQNAIVDHFRKAGSRREVSMDLTVLEAGSNLIEESIARFEEQLDDNELTGKVLRALKEANEKWYELIVLHCIEEMSYPDMAEKLNLPVSVLRARMYRARVFIRGKFGDEYEGL